MTMSTIQRPKKKIERDQEELEGALLPPSPAPAPIPLDDPLRLPSAIPVSTHTGVETLTSTSATFASATETNVATYPDIPTVAAVPVVTAVPVNQTTSVYPSQDATEKEKSEKEVSKKDEQDIQSAGYDEDTVPSAPFLPSYDEGLEGRKNKDYAEAAEMHHANRHAKTQSHEERRDISRAKEKISTKQFYEKDAIREATEEAKRRDRSGVQIKEDRWFKYEDQKPAYKEQDPDSTTYKKNSKGGYEVNEYESMYEDGEYETSEYETKEYKSVYDD